MKQPTVVYNADQLLQYTIPGLEMAIRTLQDQIKAIREIVAGKVTELPIEEKATPTGKCNTCGLEFKGAIGLSVHMRRMHKAKLLKRA